MVSLKYSTRFAASGTERVVRPVMFPPGRWKLCTSPVPIGSLLIPTIGTVDV